MKKLKSAFAMSATSILLSLAGCAANCPRPASVSIPSLPQSVVEQAQSPSNISNEVQNWRQDVLKSLQSDSKP